MIGTDEKEINEMIESLERNYKRVETQRLELDRLVKEAEQVHDDLTKQYHQYQNYEKSLIEDAKEKANQKIKAATKEADDIIKDLRQLREQKVQMLKSMNLLIRKNDLMIIMKRNLLNKMYKTKIR